MYDNQYYREIIWVTGIATKSQKRLFINEHLWHIVHYCISNKNLLSGAIQVVLKWIKLVLKCANPDLKSPN
jgi:hypothetical protein